MNETRGVYMLQERHAAAIQEMASDPLIATFTRIPHPYPPDGAAAFVAAQALERDAGTGFQFAIEDKGRLVGVCGIAGVGKGVGRELGFWVGRPFWGQGHATFGVRMLLEFAFKNLELSEVQARAYETNAASRRVLEKNGFRLLGTEKANDPMLKRRDELLCVYAITAAQWKEGAHGPAVGKLDPSLRRILEAELAAGNEIVETSLGWPEEKSVFVRLRHPFRATHRELAPGVRFARVDDPHWWTAEYTTDRPRHTLAC